MGSQNGNLPTQIRTFDEKLEHTLKILNKALKDYSDDQFFLSFNGGKDCTVLLHLVSNIIKIQSNSEQSKMLCIYLQPDQPFEEVEAFVEDCKIRYFPIVVIPGFGTKQDGLIRICKEFPAVKACLMGSRRTDPYCQNLHDFEMTSKGWPPLMRINPLLDWTCDDIWKYLKIHNVPYCSLYDIGYTSLGDKTNTVPNPHLKYFNPETGKHEYHGAYLLKNADELERVGRFITPSNGS